MPSVPPPLSPLARALVASAPVFDAHADSIGKALDLGQDLGRPGPGHLDLARGRAGGLGAFVVVAWVDPERFAEAPAARAAAMLAATHALAARHPELARLVGDGAGLRAARAAARIALVPGIEGGHALEDDLGRLAWFFEHGVRVLTLVWNNHLRWIRSCQSGAGADVPAGLSAFGREVVRTMNRLGMLVDLSHASERAFFDALETSARPVIASHSGCRAVFDHQRNLTDDQLRALAAHGGVIGIVFHPGFLDGAARTEETRVRALPAYRDAPGADPAAVQLERQRVMRALAAPLPAERLVAHVLHAVEVAGIDHVGIGSDYDGIDRGPEWLEDASCYGVLAELLLQRGFSADDVAKVLGGNMERAFAAATGPGTRAHGRAIAPLAAGVETG